MSVMTRSIIIQAPVNEVFDFAKDPGRFVATVPDFATRAAVHVIKAREHGGKAEQWLEAVRNRIEPAAGR